MNQSPCLVFHLHRTMSQALIWRSYLPGKTQLMDAGHRAEGTVVSPQLLCSLARCQINLLIPVGTK